jgi:hypothetical protein
MQLQPVFPFILAIFLTSPHTQSRGQVQNPSCTYVRNSVYAGCRDLWAQRKHVTFIQKCDSLACASLVVHLSLSSYRHFYFNLFFVAKQLNVNSSSKTKRGIVLCLAYVLWNLGLKWTEGRGVVSLHVFICQLQCSFEWFCNLYFRWCDVTHSELNIFVLQSERRRKA